MKLALAASALTLLLATPALAADARLMVAGKSHPGASVTFDIDRAWEQSRGEMAGTPMVGSYHQKLGGRPENEHCMMTLGVIGISVRRSERPVMRDGVLVLQPRSRWGVHRLRIAHRSRAGAVRFYRTRFARSATGIVVLPTPSWIRQDRPVTVVRVQVTSSLSVLVPDPRGGWRPGEPTAEQRAACDAFIERNLAPSVRQAMRSVRVVRRSS